MSKETSPSSAKKIDHDSAVLIRYIARRKYKYLGFSISIGIIASIVFKLWILGYSSTGSFFVNDMNVLSSANVDLKLVDNLTPNDNFNRIFQQTVSTDVAIYLIKKFHLTSHYGVDSTKEFYLQQTANILKKNISVKKNTYNTILVTVNDQYRYLAADLANEIMAYIDEINRVYYARNIERKLKISESFLKEIKSDNMAKSKSIDSLLSEMHHLTTESVRKTTSAIYMLGLEQRLSGLINELSNSTHDLMNSQRLYNLSLQALNQKNYRTITIVQDAMPASTSNILEAISYGCLITIAFISALIFRAYLKLHYTEYLQLLLSKDKETE